MLSAVDRDARKRLQRLAGEVARPDLKQRKKLQRALLRQERAGKRLHDDQLRRGAGIQQLRSQPVFQAPPPPALEDGVDATGAPGPRFVEERKCYVCKRAYQERHHFYDQLCPSCGELNFARRTATADLRGRVALVTGARVKIGFQASLLLLRAGCVVAACTRFPRDAAARYAREPDFPSWRERLQVYVVDLRHTPGVELLCAHLERVLPRHRRARAWPRPRCSRRRRARPT